MASSQITSSRRAVNPNLRADAAKGRPRRNARIAERPRRVEGAGMLARRQTLGVRQTGGGMSRM